MLTKDRFIIPMELELPDIPMEAEPSYGGLPNSYSVSGEMVSFVTDIPYRLGDLKVGIEAVQDLHGYDHPWVGGAGKNILNPNLLVVENRYELNADQSIKVLGSDGRAWTSVDAIPLKAGTYYIRFFGQTTYAQIRTSDDDYATFVVSLQGENEGTFTLAEDGGIKMKFALTSTYPQTIKPIISTSSITAWSPYSNICPISGWTGAEVNVTGVNIWDEEWEVGAISNVDGTPIVDNSRIRAKNYIQVIPSTLYYFADPTNGNNIKLYFYDADKNYLSTTGWLMGVQSIPSNVHYIKFIMASSYGTTYNHNISINYPSTDHDYHAYNGNTYSVSWQTEAGTVYGGTLDVTTGELVVTHAEVDLGTFRWTTYKTNGFRLYNVLPNSIKETTEDGGAICTQYKRRAFNVTLTNGEFSIAGYRLHIIDSNYTDADVFKSAMSGVYLVYELATPQTYQLTPTEVLTLLGENNIFADCGDIENLVYFTIDEVEAPVMLSAPLLSSPSIAPALVEAPFEEEHTIEPEEEILEEEIQEETLEEEPEEQPEEVTEDEGLDR